MKKLHAIQCHRAAHPRRKADWFLTETPPPEWIPGAVVVLHLAIWASRKWVRKRNYAPETARLVKQTAGNGWLCESVPAPPDGKKLARGAFLAGHRLASVAFNLAQLDAPPSAADWEQWKRVFRENRTAWDAGSRFLGDLTIEGA